MSRAALARSAPRFALLCWVLLSGCVADSGDELETHTYTVTGQVRYEDRLIDQNGFTGATVWRPVRRATIDLVSSNGNTLSTAHTDESGHFSVSGSSTGDAYLRVLALTNDPVPLEVKTPDSRALVAATKPFNADDGVLEIDVAIGADSAAGGAFNILDAFTAAGEFYRAVAGANPPPLTVYWKKGEPSPTGSTSYVGSNNAGIGIGERLHVQGDSVSPWGTSTGDADEFDDDVLWHEYGHFMEDVLGTLDSLGGAHYLDDTHQDLRLAWSEGWADFLPKAIKYWIDSSPDWDGLSSKLTYGWYIDTIGNEAAIAHDFATATLFDSIDLTHASSEGAVAKVLHDLHEKHGMDWIWHAANGMAVGSTVSTLESFWDSWRSGTADAAIVTDDLDTVLIPLDIEYADDAADADPADDDEAVNAVDLVAGTPVSRTFYRTSTDEADDVDFFRFMATPTRVYRIETFGLVNGADTRLTVTDEGFNAVAGNDNHDGASYYEDSLDHTLDFPMEDGFNNGCRLASRVEFEAAASSYLVEVSHPDQVPLAAGRYGGYTIKLTEAAGPTELSTQSPECP